MHSLRVHPQVEPMLLNLPEFRDLSTENLLYCAEVRLGLARCGAIRGIRVGTRAMAIAVLVGIRDRTEYGLLGGEGASERSKGWQ